MLDVLGGVFIFVAAVAIGTAIVIAIFSGVMMMISDPDIEETVLLTSAFPGETLVDYHVCNACLKDAKVNRLSGLMLNAMGSGPETDAVLGLIRKLSGGLWVGGRVFLTSHRIVFWPNRINRAVHEELGEVAIALEDVKSVKTRFGLVTRIVEIETEAGSLAVRLYRAKAFAQAVEEARKTQASPGATT